MKAIKIIFALLLLSSSFLVTSCTADAIEDNSVEALADTGGEGNNQNHGQKE